MKDQLVEAVAKAICEADGKEWQSGIYRVATGKALQETFHKAAIQQQIADSYEFLFNRLGSDHLETWDCWQGFQRVIRSHEQN